MSGWLKKKQKEQQDNIDRINQLIQTKDLNIAQACKELGFPPQYYYDHKMREKRRQGVAITKYKSKKKPVLGDLSPPPAPSIVADKMPRENKKTTEFVSFSVDDVKKPITIMIGDSDQIARILEQANKLR